ncbi:MAG: bifunctional uridylyltransferase/uridylyl-removing protein, partial [Rhodospirillaceae bacterium]|nr:bifunctional uridylyltransferase/uridylyl-removing protein [Rhodospirillaceae bacterium]
MAKIKKPRSIIDRKRLGGRLEEICKSAPAGKIDQQINQNILAEFKEVLEKGHNEIKSRFESGEEDGGQTYKNGSYLLDQIVVSLHEFATQYIAPPAPKSTKKDGAQQFSIIATGGYGRAEIAPYSDIDLMFLFKRKPV